MQTSACPKMKGIFIVHKPFYYQGNQILPGIYFSGEKVRLEIAPANVGVWDTTHFINPNTLLPWTLRALEWKLHQEEQLGIPELRTIEGQNITDLAGYITYMDDGYLPNTGNIKFDELLSLYRSTNEAYSKARLERQKALHQLRKFLW